MSSGFLVAHEFGHYQHPWTPTLAAKDASRMGHPYLWLGRKRQKHGWATRHGSGLNGGGVAKFDLVLRVVHELDPGLRSETWGTWVSAHCSTLGNFCRVGKVLAGFAACVLFSCDSSCGFYRAFMPCCSEWGFRRFVVEWPCCVELGVCRLRRGLSGFEKPRSQMRDLGHPHAPIIE